MRRPHRSIETFDISLMAVVTKAMGAFLVLMLLLMPYYSRVPLGKDDVLSLTRKIQEADAKIEGVLSAAGPGNVSSALTSIREDLSSGQKIIELLKRSIDQLNSQSARLAERIGLQAKEIEQLKLDKTTLTEENTRLKKEVEEQKTKIAALEKEIEELRKKIEQLSAPAPTSKELLAQIAALQKENNELRAQIRQLQTDNSNLRSQAVNLQAQVSQLQGQVSQLQGQNTQLQRQNDLLGQENNGLRSQLADLNRRNTIAVSAQVENCSNAQFAVGILPPTAVTIGGVSKTYLLNDLNTLGVGFKSAAAAQGRTSVSTAIHRNAIPGQYLITVIHRKFDGSNNDLGPLQYPTEPCSGMIVVQVTNSSYVNRKADLVTFNPQSAIEYVSTVSIADDLSLSIGAPTIEGRTWIADQVAHATFSSAPNQPAK